MAIKAFSFVELKESLIYSSIKRVKDVSGRLELVKELPNDIKFL